MDQPFFEKISEFNNLYKLENNPSPTLLPSERVRQFYDILKEEVDEGIELAEKYEKLQKSQTGSQVLSHDEAVAILTEMSDWLGDIVVYCASEAKRWGLPLEKILQIIMDSNFSKLDENGQPIYDHRGKVMKGPAYWRPEQKIASVIEDLGIKDRKKDV